MLTACMGDGGPQGAFEDGSATMTVLYVVEGDMANAVEVTMDGTDCYVDASGTHFGEDVDPAARAEHLGAVADDVASGLGFYKGAVSGLVGEESVLTVVMPDGVFVSREPIEMTDGTFEVTDLRGTVGVSARTNTSSVDDDARVSGTFTCGSTETFGR